MIKELRTQIHTSQQGLAIAARTGELRAAYLHRARLEDLVDMATRHGIDVSAWIDRALFAPTSPDEIRIGSLDRDAA